MKSEKYFLCAFVEPLHATAVPAPALRALRVRDSNESAAGAVMDSPTPRPLSAAGAGSGGTPHLSEK